MTIPRSWMQASEIHGMTEGAAELLLLPDNHSFILGFLRKPTNM